MRTIRNLRLAAFAVGAAYVTGLAVGWVLWVVSRAAT